MAVPKFDEFLGLILECLSGGAVKTRKEIRIFCAKRKDLTEDDLNELIPSGQNRFWNRVNWACSYLKTAGLVAPGKNRGDLLITEDGRLALKKNDGLVTLQYVETCPKFIEHEQLVKGSGKTAVDSTTISGPGDGLDPKERMSSSLEELNSALAEELMEQVLSLTPEAFEKMILILLKRMGYGDFQTTKLSGDEGVDGFAYEDRFRFYSIYTQAKKWERTKVVSRPEIQKFLGALAGQGATCGIFMTTARFSSEALEFVKKQLHTKIRLVDGNDLMRLMIEYDLGVAVEATYTVKRLDADFFTEEI